MKKLYTILFSFILLFGFGAVAFSAWLDPFLSIQLGDDPDANEILTTDGTDNIWTNSISIKNATTSGSLYIYKDLTVAGDTSLQDTTIVDTLINGSVTSTEYLSVGVVNSNFSYGIGDINASDDIHAVGTITSGDSGALTRLIGGASAGSIGTVGSHDFKILTDSISRMELNQDNSIDFTNGIAMTASGGITTASDVDITGNASTTILYVSDTVTADHININGNIGIIIQNNIDFWAFKYNDTVAVDTGMFFDSINGEMELIFLDSTFWQSDIITGDMTYGTFLDVDMNFAPSGTNSGLLTWMEDEDEFVFADDIFLADNETMGLGITPSANVHLYVNDQSIDTTVTYRGIYNFNVKTAGATDSNDDIYGIHNFFNINQSGGVVGDFYSNRGVAKLTLSTTSNMFGDHFLLDLNDGATDGVARAGHFQIDQEASHRLTGDASVLFAVGDFDGETEGTNHMLYLNERSNVDYGIYQNGTSVNYFQGATGIATTTPGTWYGEAFAVSGDVHIEGNTTSTGSHVITDGTNGIRIEPGATSTITAF